VLGVNIILLKKALKRDNRYQRDKKRKLCKRRAAIEPIIGHHQVRVMNRFCSYLWVVVLIPVGRIRSLFDKFQIGCVQEVCVVTL
jgi:hypothetical protein